MNAENFDKIVERRIELTRSVLTKKRKEYAGVDGDRLHNFNRAASMLGQSREKALVGMMAKHWVSILDIVDNLASDNIPTVEMIEEKIGDSINYLILLEAMLKERVEASIIRGKHATVVFYDDPLPPEIDIKKHKKRINAIAKYVKKCSKKLK